MSVTVKLPRVLTHAVTTGARHQADGDTLGEVLESLFADEPGLRNHLLDETGAIRPHVLIFVDATRADLATPVGTGSQVQVLQAVSGGQESPLPAFGGAPPFRGREPAGPGSWWAG
jgi:molybdopterin converting factor small subunit